MKVRAFGVHVGDRQVLVRRQAEIAAVHLGDLAQARQPRSLGRIGDATGFDAQRQVPATVVPFGPAEAVAGRLELERPRRLEREALPARDLGDEPLEAAVLDRVLEAGALAHGAVAEVALRGEHGLGHREQLLGLEEADDVREARVRLGVAVRGAHAAADGEVEALQLAVLDDGDEAEVVREHVHVVDGRHDDRRLELARQVGRAVERLDLLFRARHLLAVEPDLVVGARLRQQVLRELLRPFVHDRVRARLDRVRARHHVAVDVAAGGDACRSARR